VMTSLRLFDKCLECTDPTDLPDDLRCIAVCWAYKKDFKNSLSFFEKALAGTKKPSEKRDLMLNIAQLFCIQKIYDKAKQMVAKW
jgi:hypothetical protein